jgi:hypothetical protein
MIISYCEKYHFKKILIEVESYCITILEANEIIIRSYAAIYFIYVYNLNRGSTSYNTECIDI